MFSTMSLCFSVQDVRNISVNSSVMPKSLFVINYHLLRLFFSIGIL